MVEEFGEENASEVVLVGEFGEEGGGGATAGELGVYGVGEVKYEGQGVDDHEDPLAHLGPPGEPFLGVDGEKHEDDPQRVGVEDGRGVEAEASDE